MNNSRWLSSLSRLVWKVIPGSKRYLPREHYTPEVSYVHRRGNWRPIYLNASLKLVRERARGSRGVSGAYLTGRSPIKLLQAPRPLQFTPNDSTRSPDAAADSHRAKFGTSTCFFFSSSVFLILSLSSLLF